MANKTDSLAEAPAWLRAEAAPRHEAPPSSVTIKQFATAMRVRVARAGNILNERVAKGAMKRQWTGRNFVYWPVK